MEDELGVTAAVVRERAAVQIRLDDSEHGVPGRGVCSAARMAWTGKAGGRHSTVLRAYAGESPSALLRDQTVHSSKRAGKIRNVHQMSSVVSA